MPELAKKVLAQLRQERGESPSATPPPPDLSAEEVAALPLDVFGGRSLVVKVWSRVLDGEIWFASGEAQVRVLQERGVPREEIYTAQEMADLLKVFERDAEKVRLVLEAKKLFGGTMRLEDPPVEIHPPSLATDTKALVDTEETLFRTYWNTLPDKARARRTWPSEAQWYCQQKGLDVQIMEKLEHRCQDLREGRS